MIKDKGKNTHTKFATKKNKIMPADENGVFVYISRIFYRNCVRCGCYLRFICQYKGGPIYSMN